MLVEKYVRAEMEEDILMLHLSPAVKPGTIERNLIILDFPPRTICLLLRHSDLSMSEFRTHQICLLHQWTREALSRTMHLSEFFTLFDMTERTVRRAFARGPEGPFPLGHHRALDADIESSLITMLLDAFRHGKPMINK
jgi:hypothetical protein